jgi:hypothetical protein
MSARLVAALLCIAMPGVAAAQKTQGDAEPTPTDPATDPAADPDTDPVPDAEPEPEPGPAATVTDAPAATGELTQSLVTRPLLLPSGLFEGSAQVRVAMFDLPDFFGDDADIEFGELIFTDLVLRGGFGGLELALDGSVAVVIPDDTGDGYSRFERIGGQLWVGMRPRLAIGGAASVRQPTNDATSLLDVRGLAAFRKQLGAQFALEARAGLRLDHWFNKEDAGVDPEDVTILYAGGVVRAQLQASAVFAVEGYLELFIPVVQDLSEELEEADFELDSTSRLGARAVYTASAKLDVFGGIEIHDEGTFGDWTYVYAGAAARMP